MYHLLFLFPQLFVVTATLETCPLKYLVEKLGYSSYFGHYLKENATHNSEVTAICGKRFDKFICNNGTLEPTDIWRSTCKMPSQCDPLKVEPKVDRPNITLTYLWPPVNATNRYRHETLVTFSCPKHYPIGVDTYAVCINGEWMTRMHWGEWDRTMPGSCQRQCDAEKLRREKGYGSYRSTGESSKYLDNGYKMVESGTTISLFCEKLLGFGWHEWTCRDDYWLPVRPRYDKCY